MIFLTKPQRRTLFRYWKRDNVRPIGGGRTSYREFRKTVQPLIGDNSCVLFPWRGMWVGIELDGYAHT